MGKARMKVITPRECERILNINGYTFSRRSGSHAIFTNTSGLHITIKVSNINPCIWRRLCKEYNLIE